MTDINVTYRVAHQIADILEKAFPTAGARTAIRTTRIEAYSSVDGPAALLRAMAGRLPKVEQDMG